MYYKSSAHVTDIEIETNKGTIKENERRKCQSRTDCIWISRKQKIMTIEGTTLKYSVH